MCESEIPRELLQQYLNRSAANVFGRMLAQPNETATAEDLSNSRVEAPVELDSLEKPIYVGSVGFVGDINCVLYLSAIQSVMMKATARITEVNEVGLEIIPDVCGEIANILGCGFKNSLADMRQPSMPTIPTVLNGCELYVSSIDVSRYLRFRYTLFEEPVVVDLAMAKNV